MTDPNFSAIRARLRYETLDEFIDGYSRFVSTGGMFIPMAPSKLKPVGTTIRFQFLLNDGTTAMLGEGVVRQIQGADTGDNSPVGMLVKFSRLHRDTKGVVEQIVARKSHDAPPALATESENFDEAAEQPEQQAAADANYVEANVPPASDAQTRDAEQPKAQPAPPADVAPDDDPHDEERSLDAMFLPADDASDDAPFEPDQSDTGEEPVADESAPIEPELAASGSDVFGEAAPSSHSESPEEPAAAAPATAGPKELGRTEAGLQIMAFDDVSDDEMADFAGFDFGGDEDDVDQMFDGIFGGGSGGGSGDDGGGLFGGGGDGSGGFFGDSAEGDSELDPTGAEGLVGDSINDGGTPVDEAPTEDEDDAVEATFDLDDNFILDDEDEYEQEPAEEVAFEEEDQTSGLEEENGDQFDFDDDLDEAIELEEEAYESEPVDETYDLDEEVALDEEAIELDEEFELDEEAIELDEADVVEEEAVVEQEGSGIPEAPAPIAAQGLGEESSAPSAELMSALGALDSSAEDNRGFALGTSAAVSPEPQLDEPEEEDDESLEALLAKAQRDIDAKRESDEKDEKVDILDELLGDDDMPPPPSHEPVFDINDSPEKKKKKGGFISKLFGKD